MATYAKKAIALVMTLAMVLSLFALPVSAAESTEGYIEISTASELLSIADNMSGNYKLTADITLTEGIAPIGSITDGFKGVLDGNGHTIENLHLIAPSAAESSVYCGLFAYLNGGTICNLRLENVTAEIKEYKYLNLGAVVGKSNKGSITGCEVSGNFQISTGSYYARVGGIAGTTSSTNISKSVSSLNINYNGALYGALLGGLVGDFTGTIDACGNIGNIVAVGTGNDSSARVGGIVGTTNSSTAVITNSINHGSLTVSTKVDAVAGGIVGDGSANCSLENNISLGKITSGSSFESGFNPDFATIGAGAVAGKFAGQSGDNYYLSSVYSKAVGKGTLTASVKTVAELRTLAENNENWANPANTEVGPWIAGYCFHSYKVINSEAADCTTAGFTTYECEICQDTYTVVIPALGHIEETVKGYAADCVNTGLTDGTKCTVCGETIKAQEVIEALGHTEEIVPGYAADCTNPGLTDGVRCSVCDEVLTEPEEIEALGHNYEAVVTPPTCDEAGFTTYTCSVCGNTYEDDVVDALGHKYEGVVTKEPTCTEKGVKTFTCACGDSYTEELNIIPHTEEEIPAVAPTCKETGLTAGVKCSVCGEVLEAPEEVPVDENAHVEEEIPAVAATCKDVGYTAGVKCSVCDEVLEAPEEIDIDENNHAGETEVVDAEPADCTEPGYTGDTICSDCGATLTEGEEIAALGHKYEAVVTPPTCDEAGFTTYTCSVCNNTYDADEVPASGHKYDDGVVTKKPTCTEKGVETFSCICGDSYTKEIPATGHTEKTVKGYAATCTKTGLTDGVVCSVCGATVTAQKTIAKKAHTPVELKAKAATCTKTGLTKGSKCSQCGTILTAQKTVAKKAHSYKTTTTKATLKKNGKIVKKCSVCGKTASTTTIYYAKTVKLSSPKFTYTGKTIKPTLVVKTSKGKTIPSKYYTVTGTASTKKIGKFKITLKFKGNYSGTKTLYYTINPKTVASLKLKAGKKQMTVSYKKDSSVGGYEIVYATNKSFKKAKTTKATSAKKTIKKLTSKKTYYVKVRAYKKVSGKTYYGAYCKAKTVKVK